MADKTLKSITFPGLPDRYVVPETVVDATLTQTGKAADAKAAGDAITLLNQQINAITDLFSVDSSILQTYTYLISNTNKWSKVGTSSNSRAGCVKIPNNAISVKITYAVSTGIMAFLKTYNENGEVVNNGTPNFSTGYGQRISSTIGTVEYKVTEDMNYIYFLLTTSAGADVRPTGITFVLSSEIYSVNLYPYAIINFAQGGIDYSTGGNTSTSSRVRTNNYYRISHNYLFLTDAKFFFRVVYYDVNRNIVGNSSDWIREAIIRKTDFPGAEYFRLVFSSTHEDANMDLQAFNVSQKIIVTDDPIEYTPQTVFTPDVPEHIGVLNVLSRAKQCAELAYMTKAVLPNQHGDIAADTQVTGVCYSSVRDESLYVPNCVSFDSYMTALLNPNSYIYTKTSTAPNSKTYMGTVCSAFVSYALGLPCVYTTHQIGELDDIELVEDQSIYGLKLGDMLLRKNSHIALITDIYRDSRGRIKYIGETEAEPPFVVRRIYTPSGLATAFPSTFKTYRYKKINSVGYTPTQWVAVEDEAPAIPVYNTNLSPRRGDKSNWRYGEDVEIDVMEPGEYTNYILYKGETQVGTSSIPANNLIVLENLETGNYKVCLTDGSNTSDFVYFAVVNVAVTVEDQGNGVAKVGFVASDNAVPVWLAWCYPSGSDINAAKQCDVITAEDIENGYSITTFEAGSYKFKVEVQTDYGVYSSDFVSATIT